MLKQTKITLTVLLAIFFLPLFFNNLFLQSAFADNSFLWPLEGEIIKGFVDDEHRGIDIKGRPGSEVYSFQEGHVYWVGKTPRGETYISIEHPNGITSTYLPVDPLVQKGQDIKCGEKIALLSEEIDSSSNENHLHFGLYKTDTRSNKTYLDPTEFLPPLNLTQQHSGSYYRESESLAQQEHNINGSGLVLQAEVDRNAYIGKDAEKIFLDNQLENKVNSPEVKSFEANSQELSVSSNFNDYVINQNYLTNFNRRNESINGQDNKLRIIRDDTYHETKYNIDMEHLKNNSLGQKIRSTLYSSNIVKNSHAEEAIMKNQSYSDKSVSKAYLKNSQMIKIVPETTKVIKQKEMLVKASLLKQIHYLKTNSKQNSTAANFSIKYSKKRNLQSTGIANKGIKPLTAPSGFNKRDLLNSVNYLRNFINQILIRRGGEYLADFLTVFIILLLTALSLRKFMICKSVSIEQGIGLVKGFA